jgi:ABC-type multidrug transport system fused ATPase/permease subunit
LFEGTVRSNLDPEGIYKDEELWAVLSKCRIASMVRSLSTSDSPSQQQQKNAENSHSGMEGGARTNQQQQTSGSVVSESRSRSGNSRSGLDAMVTECGNNLSAGQGQLLCLARVVIPFTHPFLFTINTTTVLASSICVNTYIYMCVCVCVYICNLLVFT